MTVLEKHTMTFWDGDLDRLSDLPVESFVPMMFGKHVGSYAAEFDINP